MSNACQLTSVTITGEILRSTRAEIRVVTKMPLKRHCSIPFMQPQQELKITKNLELLVPWSTAPTRSTSPRAAIIARVLSLCTAFETFEPWTTRKITETTRVLFPPLT